MEENKVKIEIWSDVVCPFCYVGKRKLEKAIKKLNMENKVEIEWKSFQLDPDFPMEESIASMPYLSERKGYPIQQVEAMCNQLETQGKVYNIDFNFEKALTFNTFNAHRLIQWAKNFGKSNELKEALMKAYFTDGLDLSKESVLLAIVESCNLKVNEAKEILNSSAYKEEVNNDIYQSRQLGIRGVPYFLINENQSISGAQSDPVFESILSASMHEFNTINSKQTEGYCAPEGECK